MDIRFRGKSGRAADITGMTEFDPACVKTHTIANVENTILQQGIEHRTRSTIRLHGAQFSSRCFYVRGGRWSFRTAKTHTGHMPDRNPAAQQSPAVPRCAILSVLSTLRTPSEPALL